MSNWCANINKEMRLINVDSLDIESSFGQTKPYVILSHRWSPHEVEVKFEDYASVKDKIKDQYQASSG